MYKTFLEYNENRDDQTFGSKYATLCEAIATSGVPFEKYWENVGLPTVLKTPYMRNEDDLLNEFWKGLGQKIGGMFGMGGGQQAAPAAPAAAPQPHKHQGRADASVKSVSEKFQVAMRDFLKSVSDEAKQNNDRFTWQIAKMFHDKAVKSMQSFAVNVKNGQDPMAAQFSNDRSAMQGQKQADMKQRLTQQMQSDPSKGAKLALMKMQKAAQGNPSMGLATFYSPQGGFTQAAASQFGIPAAWVGKTVEAIGGAGGGTGVGGPPVQKAPVNSSTAGGMHQPLESKKNEGDLMFESLVETYSHRSKFYPF